MALTLLHSARVYNKYLVLINLYIYEYLHRRWTSVIYLQDKIYQNKTVFRVCPAIENRLKNPIKNRKSNETHDKSEVVCLLSAKDSAWTKYET